MTNRLTKTCLLEAWAQMTEMEEFVVKQLVLDEMPMDELVELTELDEAHIRSLEESGLRKMREVLAPKLEVKLTLPGAFQPAKTVKRQIGSDT